MEQYLKLLRKVHRFGEDRPDRTGTGTRSLFGAQLKFHLCEGFPLITTKKMFLKGIIHELLWMLRGETNIDYLQKNNVHIWDAWANEYGDLGPVYGKQWRDWPGWSGFSHDQINEAIKLIKNDPYSRRIIVSAWNVSDLHAMSLPPCHCFFQFYVHVDGTLDLHLYQRSADMFLGVPFDIAEYALLLMMVAQVTDKKPGKFIYSLGDCHIYKNHFKQVKEQLSRTARHMPKMIINPNVKDIDAFTYTDFKLEGYDPWPAIKGEISV